MNVQLSVENEKKRLSIKFVYLVCFSMFTAWQMGVVYFSGQALSVSGRTPFPFMLLRPVVVIVAGYLAGILFLIFIPRMTVWAERILTALALASIIAAMLPISGEIKNALFTLHCLCCTVMIPLESALITCLFSTECALKHLLVAYAAGEAAVAALHSGLIKLPNQVFFIFTVTALLAVGIFSFKLPSDKWPGYVKKADRAAIPERMFCGLCMLTVLSCLFTLFGVAFAENIKHGVAVYYLSAGLAGIIAYCLWKRFKILPFRSVTVLVALGGFGVVFAIASIYARAFALLSCVFLGAGFTLLCLLPFHGIMLMRCWPSRFITPSVMLAALLTLVAHGALTELFGGEPLILYTVYLIILIAVTIVYLAIEPHLISSYDAEGCGWLYGTSADAISTGEISAKKNEPDKSVPDTGGYVQAVSAAEDVFSGLSGQEMRLAKLIMQGYVNSEIADRLNITENTAKSYRKNLYSKLQIHSKRELFALSEAVAASKDTADTAHSGESSR